MTFSGNPPRIRTGNWPGAWRRSATSFSASTSTAHSSSGRPMNWRAPCRRASRTRTSSVPGAVCSASNAFACIPGKRPRLSTRFARNLPGREYPERMPNGLSMRLERYWSPFFRIRRLRRGAWLPERRSSPMKARFAANLQRWTGLSPHREFPKLLGNVSKRRSTELPRPPSVRSGARATRKRFRRPTPSGPRCSTTLSKPPATISTPTRSFRPGLRVAHGRCAGVWFPLSNQENRTGPAMPSIPSAS